MAERSPARLLAPLALIVAFVAIVAIVSTSKIDRRDAVTPLQRTTTTHTAHHAKPKHSSYLVKPGDNLTAIADRTGVSIDTIERLNPDLDPQALQAGARLKLTP